MQNYYIGELYSLGVAACDGATCSIFKRAQKHVSVFTINYVQIFIAFLAITLIRLLFTGTVSMAGIGLEAWIYLSASGLMGYIFGNMFYFLSFKYLPLHISMMIFYTSPIVTSLAAYFMFGQVLSLLDIAAIVIIISGLSIMLLTRNNKNGAYEKKTMWKGVIFAVLGMLGQAFGIILSMIGLKKMSLEASSLAATQIRTIAAFAGYNIIALTMGRYSLLKEDAKNKKCLGLITIGGIIGSAIGSTLTLQALDYIPAGIVLAINSVSPILILPVSVFVFKEKLKLLDLAGAVVCITGVVILSI